jgi:outer membrane protein TolC
MAASWTNPRKSPRLSDLAALRVLGVDAQAEASAVTQSQRALELIMDRYCGGASDYLNVVVNETTFLSNERQATAIAGGALMPVCC